MTQLAVPGDRRTRQKRELTPESLFEYADTFARKAEKAGKGTCYPTFREAARYFRVRLSDIEDTCNDYGGDHYMKPAVGFRTGGGWGSYACMGDWLVEAFKELEPRAS